VPLAEEPVDSQPLEARRVVLAPLAVAQPSPQEDEQAA